MEHYYLFLIIALAVLAIADLVVGVSNDAVNFLNSALGSKAVSFRTVMIVASVGVAFGALFSSGLMEVARKGIFVPEHFVFTEIMVIFMAVMITDIILLDFFNSIGLPTSTTVSIVFELLGAAVCVALIKMSAKDQSFNQLFDYINTDQAVKIIMGIFLSVFIAFLVGALIQYLSRLVLSFKFEEKANWVAAIFGGLALSAITYFILIKGLKGTGFVNKDMIKDIQKNFIPIIGINIVVWTAISGFVIKILKSNIYKLIIIVGTFALALAFAGNDLVNFIGVPIAAWISYDKVIGSGTAPEEYYMAFLGDKVDTPQIFLVAAGLIMVVTLWMSKKARKVVKTSIDLSRQDEGQERFKPNELSRLMVRAAIILNKAFVAVTPNSTRNKINTQFEKANTIVLKTQDAPAFDMVRASVNLVVASVLISVATSWGLPLSTTYVTFMVAMGTSLADRAWGTESAVYRVAGVLNVIGGWFLTAIIAFTAAATLAMVIHKLGGIGVVLLLVLAIFMLIRSSIRQKKQNELATSEDKLHKAESNTIQGVIEESSENVASFARRCAKILGVTIDGLAKQDLPTLKKSKKGIAKLNDEIEDLRDSIFYFIKNLEESSVGASNFYISIIGHLQDMAESLDYIARASHKHINNNHRKLRFNQIKDLKEVDSQVSSWLLEIKEIFESQEFEGIKDALLKKDEVLSKIDERIERQIERTRNEESSPKNTTLYFKLLSESKALVNSTYNLLESYMKSAE